MKKMDQKGFTLIELMIVIAIIGILAAIAIPNFIAYRNKAYCSAAESDADGISAGLADYFAIPVHTLYPARNGVNTITFFARSGQQMDTVEMSGENTADLTPVAGVYRIVVNDASTRCPQEYMQSQAAVGLGEGWVAAGNYFRKIM